MRISVYRFVTTFCLVPVTDWGAFLQRVVGRLLLGWLFLRLLSLLKQPLFIASLIGLLIWAPDTITWIFIKIGELEIRAFTVILNAVMPDIFAAGGGEYSNWASIWSQGLSVLPPDVVEIMNGLGVANLLGLVTGTIGAVSLIRVYRRVMLRGGLL